MVVSKEEFKDTSQLQINDFIGSLISYEFRMSRYDDDTLEIAFKNQLQFNRASGRVRLSNRGKGDRVADQRHPRNNYGHEEKS